MAARKLDSFPSLKELNEIIDEEILKIKIIHKKDPAWVSTRCPGCPALIEAICEHFEKSTIDQKHVRQMIEFSGFTIEKLWDIYESWFEGKLHESVKTYTSNTPRIVEYLAGLSTRPVGEPESGSQDR